MSARASFRFTDNQLAGWLRAAKAKGSDFSAPLSAAGEIMVRSTQKTMEQQGRPNRFKPLSPVTIRLRAGRYKSQKRRAAVAAGAKILIDRGRLIKSITYKTGRKRVAWGTNLVPARILQLGGKAGRGKKVPIPPRPYINPPFDEDARKIEGVLKKWVEDIGARS